MELAAQLAADAAERLFRYVQLDTQSDEDSETYPSTEKQLELLRLLLDELQQIGLADAQMDVHGYVTATIPATVEGDITTIAFFATKTATCGSSIALRTTRSFPPSPRRFPETICAGSLPVRIDPSRTKPPAR